jgi:anthranilate phosphoribosyltransferase
LAELAHPDAVTAAPGHPGAAAVSAEFAAILDGQWPQSRIAEFLTALHERGETPADIEACARAMLRRCVRLPSPAADIGGTGGDGAGTFNISTTAALVMAAAGVPVVKHGNRAVTGACGSLDMLHALGVHVPDRADVADLNARLAGCGFAVAPTPVFHRFPAQLTSARRALGFPTVFNLAGPLAHPAAILTGQVVGVADASRAAVLARTLRRLGRTRAAVLHGQGTDEPSLAGPTQVTALAGEQVETFEVTPEQFGLRRAGVAELAGGDPALNAGICRTVLSGGTGPHRDVVLLTAGIALWTAGTAPSVGDGVAVAGRAIDSGAAGRLLRRLTRNT